MSEALEHTRLIHSRQPRRDYYRRLFNTPCIFLGDVSRDTGQREEWVDVLRQRREL